MGRLYIGVCQSSVSFACLPVASAFLCIYYIVPSFVMNYLYLKLDNHLLIYEIDNLTL